MIEVVALSCALLAAPPASEAFDAHVAAAREHYKAERFVDAAAELEAAYELSPEPDVLLNWANAERLAGECERAVPLYDRYLEASDASDELSGQYADIAREKREECAKPEPEPAAVAVPAPAASRPPPPRVVHPTPPPAPTPIDKPARRASTDPTAWTLTSIGIAGLATGAGLLGGAHRRESDALSEPSHDAYLSEVRTASRLEAAGWSLLGIGGAALIGGVIRFALVSRRAKRSQRGLVYSHP